MNKDLLQTQYHKLIDIFNDNVGYFSNNIPQATKMFFILEYVHQSLYRNGIDLDHVHNQIDIQFEEYINENYDIKYHDITNLFQIETNICDNFFNYKEFISFIKNGIKDSWFMNQIKRDDLLYEEYIKLLSHEEMQIKYDELKFLMYLIRIDKYELNDEGYLVFDKIYKLTSEWRCSQFPDDINQKIFDLLNDENIIESIEFSYIDTIEIYKEYVQTDQSHNPLFDRTSNYMFHYCKLIGANDEIVNMFKNGEIKDNYTLEKHFNYYYKDEIFFFRIELYLFYKIIKNQVKVHVSYRNGIIRYIKNLYNYTPLISIKEKIMSHFPELF
jgi:hypothetical protein